MRLPFPESPVPRSRAKRAWQRSRSAAARNRSKAWPNSSSRRNSGWSEWSGCTRSPTLVVEAEVHGGRVFVEVGVAVLQLLELAVDLAQLLVDLGQLARPQPQLAFGPDLLGDVGEMAAQVGDA